MNKQYCIVHTNCQGDALLDLLAHHPGFTEAYEARYTANYTKETISDEDMARCDLFIHQGLGAHWKELSAESMIARLPETARVWVLPNPWFKGYWPFWKLSKEFEYADEFLDTMLERGHSKDEILHLYLKTDITRFMDVQKIWDDSTKLEYRRERVSAVRFTDYVLEHFRDRLLFHTPNHPGMELLFATGDALLDFLGLEPFSQEQKAAIPNPFADFTLPIHPQVAKMQGLSFMDENYTFNVYGRPTTFAEYVNLYLECKLAEEKDFVSFLQWAVKKLDAQPLSA